MSPWNKAAFFENDHCDFSLGFSLVDNKIDVDGAHAFSKFQAIRSMMLTNDAEPHRKPKAVKLECPEIKPHRSRHWRGTNMLAHEDKTVANSVTESGSLNWEDGNQSSNWLEDLDGGASGAV